MSARRTSILSLTLTVALALGGGSYTAYLNEQWIAKDLTRLSDLVTHQWREQLLKVEHGVRGLRATVVARGAEFNQGHFDTYMQSRDLRREFPIVRSFCVVKRVSLSEQTTWLSAATAENTTITFRQLIQHNDDRYIIQYIEPIVDFKKGLGLDLGSEPLRRQTLDSANQLNSLQLSPPLRGSQHTSDNTPDYIAVMPIFLPDNSQNFGWVGALIFVQDIFSELDHVGDDIALIVTDKEKSFNSSNQDAVDTTRKWLFGANQGVTIHHRIHLEMTGRSWQIDVLPTAKFYTNLNLSAPWLVAGILFIIGTLINFVIATQHQRRQEQEALEKNQRQQLGYIIDAAPCGMMLISARYEFLAVNKQLCDLTGYSRKELLAVNFQTIMGENGQGNNILTSDSSYNFNSKNNASAVNFEMMVRRKDGSIFPAAIGFSTLKLGKKTNIVATVEDISNRRLIERQIAESEAMFRQLANAMPQHVWTFDAKGKLTYANQRCLDYFQTSFTKLADETWSEFIHPDDRKEALKTWQRSLASGENYHAEFRIKRHDGAYLWHMSRAVIAKNSKGDILSWYGTNTDISDTKKAQSNFENSAKNTQAIINSIVDAIITISEQGKIQSFNQSATEIFGYTEQAVLGKNVSILMPESYRDQHQQYLTNYLTTGDTEFIGKSIELDGQHADGSIFKMEFRVAENRSDDARYFIGMVRDISERYYNEKLLATQDHILGLIARNVEVAVSLEALILDIEALSPGLKASILQLDSSGQRLLHVAGPSLPSAYNAAINGEIIGPNVGSCGTAAYLRKQVITEDIATDPHWQDYRELALSHNLRACWSTPIFSKNQLLGTFAIYYSTPRLPTEKHRRVINMATHVASLAITHDQREAQIRQLAFYDSLTKLPNRSLGMDRLNRSITDAQRRNEKLAVIFIDLDSFKTINDSLGHHVGDKILQLAAGRLISCVRENDTVARLGGDEFFVILNGSSDNIAEVVTQKILTAMAESFDVDSHVLHATCSIGVSIYPSDGQDASTLIRNADAAMYRAKETGRNNVKYYTEEMNRTAVERITLEQEIRKGIERNEFVLYYQPRVNNATHKVIGVEALIRWQHPTRGLTTPNVFIPVAEQSGLIVPLGDWVLNQACNQLNIWQSQGVTDIAMAVNLSPRQFNDKYLIEKVEAALSNHHLPAKFLELEITESMVMDEDVNILATLSQLKSIGVTLAVDDFGTGYSNLSRLKHLPVDVLKIDKSFVDGIPDDIDDVAIASTIIAMAHHLKLKIVAEGVETFKQQEFLSAKHCDEMQGYLFGKPEPENVTSKLLGLNT